MIEILYVLGNIFYALALDLFFENTLNRKYNKYRTLFSIIIVLVFSDFILIFFDARIKMIVYEIVVFTMIYFLYDNNIKKKIIVLFMGSVFSVISEVLVDIVLKVSMVQNENYYIMGYVLSKIVFFLIVRLVNLKKDYNNDYLLENSTLISIIVIPILSSVIVILYYLSRNPSNVAIIDVIFYGVVFVINYINVIQYENVQKMLKLQKKNELLVEQKKSYLFQYEQNQKNMDSIMRIKHNIKNDYIRQKIMLDNKDYDGLMELYRQKVNNVESVVQESNTGNNVFDSVINYKLSEIKKDDVKYDVNISIPQVLNVEDEDIILILGNLLDNVGEAFEKCEGIEKHGKLNILYDKGMLYIETGNSFSKKLNKDREGKIRSTKKDSDWHGIGLRAIEEIVKKYNGDMIITDENNYFTVKIIMEI